MGIESSIKVTLWILFYTTPNELRKKSTIDYLIKVICELSYIHTYIHTRPSRPGLCTQELIEGL